MHSILCQVVPVLLLSGCFLAHGNEDAPIPPGPPRPGPDAGPDSALPCPPPDQAVCCTPEGREVAPLGEGCAPIDCPAGSAAATICVPATLECAPARADFTCMSPFRVEPGQPFSLPYAFDSAHCCSRTECAVEVRGDRQLRLTTTQCPDPCDCDTGTPGPTGSCEVPALDPGLWDVYVNDEFAYRLPVQVEAPGLLPEPAECREFAEADMCGLGGPVDGRSWRAVEACIEDNFGQPRIRMFHQNWNCVDLDATCVVRVEETGVPGERVITVSPAVHTTNCLVSCNEIPIRHERVCNLPALDPDFTYTVRGAIDFNFTLDAGPFCVGTRDG